MSDIYVLIRIHDGSACATYYPSMQPQVLNPANEMSFWKKVDNMCYEPIELCWSFLLYGTNYSYSLVDQIEGRVLVVFSEIVYLHGIENF